MQDTFHISQQVVALIDRLHNSVRPRPPKLHIVTGTVHRHQLTEWDKNRRGVEIIFRAHSHSYELNFDHMPHEATAHDSYLLVDFDRVLSVLMQHWCKGRPFEDRQCE